MIWRKRPQCSDVFMAFLLLFASCPGTEGIRATQWQRQEQLSHADQRRDLQQVSVSLPILGELGGTPSSSPSSGSTAQGIEEVAGSITSPSSPPAALTTSVPTSAAAANASASPDHASPNTSPAAGPTGNGAASTQASPSPTLLSILPDIMQVLNSESQAGDSSRSLNITVSAAAMSPTNSTDDAPAVSGSLANATVESSPHRVDVQVTVNPVINVQGDILNISSDQLQAAQINAVPLPLGSIIPRPQLNQKPDDPPPPPQSQPAPLPAMTPDPAPPSGDDQGIDSMASAPAAAAAVPPPHVLKFYAEDTPPPTPSGPAAPAPSSLPGGMAAGRVPADPVQARVLSSSPAPQDDNILVPAMPPQADAPPQVAGLLVQPQPGSDDADNGGSPQFALLPPKPPALPANSTVPLQVVGSLLAALSNSQQSPAAPVATAPQLAGTGSSATSPLPPRGAPVLDDPQIADALDAMLDAREAPQGTPPASDRGSLLFAPPATRQGEPTSASSSSKHYPFDWAVVIAAVSSTATFMLLIVLLLAFASGFLPHRRRRGVPASPKSLKSVPPGPGGGGAWTPQNQYPQNQYPQTPAAGRRLSRKPSAKSIGFLGHRLSSWTRPRRTNPGAQDLRPAPLHSSGPPGKEPSSDVKMPTPNSPDLKMEAVSAVATAGRSLGRQVSFPAISSGPRPLRSPFADPSILLDSPSLPHNHSGAESAALPEQAELAEPQPDQAHPGNFPNPIASPFANAAAPALPTPHVRATADISPRSRDFDDAASQRSGREPPSAKSDSEQLSGSYLKNRWSPGARPPPMRTPFAKSVLPAFSSLSTNFSDGYSTATESPTSGSSALETQKRLSMIIQQVL